MIRLLFAVSFLGVFGIWSWALGAVMIGFTVYLYVLLGFSFFKRKKLPSEDYSPLVSVLIPARNEQSVIRKTVESIARQDYRNLEIIVIDDASSDQTPHVLWSVQQSCPMVKVLRRELSDERGKPAALNDALKIAKGEIIAVFDADSNIEPGFISKVVPHLQGRKIAGVQTAVRMYNKNRNLWTMVQDSEFAIHCSIIQQGRDNMGGYCGLGGNGQFVKRSALDAVGGWKTGMLAEDMDLTLCLLEEGYRIRYLGVAVEQEAVETGKALVRQRTRWSQGGFQSTLRHARDIVKNKNMKLRTKLDTLFVFSLVIQPFITIASFIITAIDIAGHLDRIRHFQLHWSSLLLFSAYVIFVAVGHIKGKPEDWKWIVVHIVAYYVYSLMWPFLYLYSIAKYIWKRGNIAWVKTAHFGSGQENTMSA